MAEHPLPMSAPMVRAILDGKKTQTRRLVKPQPQMVTDMRTQPWDGSADVLLSLMTKAGKTCPYGKSGDQLWVRETVFINHFMGLQVPVAERADCELYYRATDEADMRKWEDHEGIRWTPSIHMPRWASRITLELTGVRVERLQDISEADARAEGIDYDPGEGGVFHVSGLAGCCNETAIGSYRKLWESIYGTGSWAANPWVWVLLFKKVAA